MMCHKIGLSLTAIMGLAFMAVYSDMRVSRPSARITAFTDDELSVII
jgi:hypothetical protein